MDFNGNPVGGVFGFIRSLTYFIEQFAPTKIFICWDGEHGSQKRRTIFKEYKEGRKVPSLNRTYEFTEDELNENRSQQFRKLKEQYFEILPVKQLEYEFTEADDVISLICLLKKDAQKIIISSDKDFFQLCDEKTVCYNPVKREFKSSKKILEEFNISSSNFALARSIVGDSSDNIKGIKGIGMKTVIKLFPFLSEQKEHVLSDVFEHCKKNISENSKYEKILESSDYIAKVFSIVQLRDSILPMERINQIKKDIEEKVNYEPVAFRMLVSDDLPNFDIDRAIMIFNGFFFLDNKNI